MAAPRVSHSAEETLAIARELGSRLQGGTAVLLRGELGAGKTVFARGLAEGLGVSDPGIVTSPTFTIVHEYSGRHKIFHIDLYRLASTAEIDDLGLEDLAGPESVLIIEWAEKLARPASPRNVLVRLADLGGDDREIEIAEEQC